MEVSMGKSTPGPLGLRNDIIVMVNGSLLEK
jgi:hypothetical protein